MLDHERLDAYQLTLEFLANAFAILERFPKGHAKLADQLRRAAVSIPLYIAEGSGKPTGPDRRRFYAIARGSAMECAAVVDVCRLLAIVDLDHAAQSKNLLERIVAMLSRMAR